jgi:hypothetical protein
MMLLLNFGHPLTDAQLARIRELAGRDPERLIAVPTQFDHARPFAEQVRELLATVPLTPEQWQTTPLLVNPPSLAPITAVLLAELHGRCGYFPTIVRLRPMAGRSAAVRGGRTASTCKLCGMLRELDEREGGSCSSRDNAIAWSRWPGRRRRGRF